MGSVVRPAEGSGESVPCYPLLEERNFLSSGSRVGEEGMGVPLGSKSPKSDGPLRRRRPLY